jgi:hypothetical protein
VAGSAAAKDSSHTKSADKYLRFTVLEAVVRVERHLAVVDIGAGADAAEGDAVTLSLLLAPTIAPPFHTRTYCRVPDDLVATVQPALHPRPRRRYHR